MGVRLLFDIIERIDSIVALELSIDPADAGRRGHPMFRPQPSPPSPAPIILEITPPVRPRIDILLRRAGMLGDPHRQIVNVIARPDRWASVSAAAALRDHGFDAVWHLTTRGRALAQIEREIERAAEAGLRRVLCLRGERCDESAEAAGPDPRIRDVVALIRRRLPGASIGVTLNHHLPQPGVLPNLLGKLDAGADFVQTQLTFTLRGLGSIAESLHRRFPDVALIPMIGPVLRADAARATARRLRIPLDQALHDALERGGEEAGWRAFAARLDEIRTSHHFATAALMTPMDPAPGYVARLRAFVAGERADRCRAPESTHVALP
jgi:5,10-methylenetetrahydrofolate reductase